MDISYNDSTKEKIIEILSYDWPLSLRKIYYLLKKKGVKITYQAIHKAVSQLLHEKKVKRDAEGYSINLEWIKDIHDKTDIIRVNYFSKKKSVIMTGNDERESIQVFIFKNWFDVEKYLYYLQKKTIKKYQNKQVINSDKSAMTQDKQKLRQSICIHHHHEWRPLFYMRAEYNWIKQLRDSGYKVYTICSGRSVIDNWSKKFYEHIGNNVITGIKLTGAAEIIVFQDLVIEVYIPFELLKKLDDYLKKTTSIDNVDTVWLAEEIFDYHTEIKTVIHKDSKLATEIRNHLISNFKKYDKKQPKK